MSGWAAAGVAVALASAALMGLAIQRGATCMVAAVDEVVTARRVTRALALGEAALWVGGLLALAQLAGVPGMVPSPYTVSGWTIVGGVLLGLGAWINRACVFGAIARIGSGQWAWLATPIGFYLGCLIPLHGPVALSATPHAASFAHAGIVALVIAVPMLWRLAEAVHAPALLAHLWHPHRATLLIALTFVATLLTVGLWAYTDALAALAHGMEARLTLRLAMVAALLAGAIAGGWIAGLLKPTLPSARDVLRCAIGGAAMGVGAMLVPGSNDGLILIGLPLLLPHAWVAVSVMALSIATAIRLARATPKAVRAAA